MALRILVVEDDPVTSAYLSAVVEALPAEVDAADSLAAAHAQVRRHDYALWLIDAHLPDGDGRSLLAELRAAGLRTPALAHTASPEQATLDALVGAGFIEALVKPMTAATLLDAVRRALPAARSHGADTAGTDTGDGVAVDAAPATAANDGPAPSPIWNDRAALAALNGQRNHVEALRALFVGELPDAREAVIAAARRADTAALRATLHRLCASCGFVGATRLEAAVRALHDAPDSGNALSRFDRACQDVLSSI